LKKRKCRLCRKANEIAQFKEKKMKNLEEKERETDRQTHWTIDDVLRTGNSA